MLQRLLSSGIIIFLGAARGGYVEDGGTSLRGSTQRTISPLSTPHAKTPIHMSVSAFQDGDRCAKTLRFALENAVNPERVSFGVVQAREVKDVDCIQEFQERHLPQLCEQLVSSGRSYSAGSCADTVLSQIRSSVIPPQQAMGPSHQRGLQKELIRFDRQDKFCMQTDSHMDFLQSWDKLLMDDWQKVNNEFAVLTAYVMDIKAKAGNYAHTNMVDCCGWTEDGDGMPRGNGCGDFPRVETPYLTMNWAAGFSFHRCHAEQNVPVDPNLQWIFTGEEVDRAARLWTSGYDLYLPTRAFVLHNYSHAQQRFWNYGGDTAGRKGSESRLKVSELLELHGRRSTPTEHTGHYFTLGRQRTINQWKEFVKPAYNAGDQACRRLGLVRFPVADPTGLEASARDPEAHEL